MFLYYIKTIKNFFISANFFKEITKVKIKTTLSSGLK